VLTIVIFASGAAAQDTDEPAGYRELVQQAVEEYGSQNYVEARSLFARAHRVYPNARTLRGLGVVAFDLHTYAECVKFLDSALASHVRALSGDLRRQTEELLQRARGFVAVVTLEVRPSSAHVLVDGAPLERSGSGPITLDLGQHQLMFRAPGYVSQERRLAVEGGEQLEIAISLAQGAEDEAGQRAVTPLVSGQPSSLQPWKRAALGTSVAAIALTATAVAMRQKYANESQRVCEDESVSCTKARAQASNWRVVAIAGGGVGALLTTATVVLFALDARRASAPVAHALRGCSPDLSAHGLHCRYEF
jgi:hypothetical protein